MKINVLLYGSTDNPLGIPPEWPHATSDVLPDDAPLPPSPWIQMTVAEYDVYRAEHQHLYTAWEAAQPAPTPES